MGNQEFSLREMYDCAIKTTYPIEINGKYIEEGEIIGYFDSIQLANFQEIVNRVAATGGWDNRAQVTWETTKEIDLVFTSGIFSKEQLALMINAGLARNDDKEIKVHQREYVETDEFGKVKLKYEPYEKVYVYDSNGNKLPYICLEDKELQLLSEVNAYQDLIVDYYYIYKNGNSTMVVGQQLLTGFVELEAKTRVKDDVTGQTHTGIIRIPRMKIMSDFAIRLGKQANPYVSSLKAVGYPVGSRHQSSVMEITYLDDDVDSDI